MVFLGAFLSFGMEPIVGRLVTPYFGGAVHVWTVSLTFFQVLLLAGYCYAHWVAPRIGRGHLLVLLLPLLQWPLAFHAEVAPTAPVATLAAALFAQTSLPFAVLCTTAVVAQSWWHRAGGEGHAGEPYFLYAISNLGALLALFIYPFAVEPFFGVLVQRWTWSVGYLAYIAVAAGAWLRLRPSGSEPTVGTRPARPVPYRTAWRWLLLSAAPSALLLAVTNLIALEVGSFPMVWVVPLALYLASFIVAFQDRGESIVRWLEFWAVEIGLLALLAAVLKAWLMPLVLVSFFCLSLVANKRLYRLRPEPAGLTGYYLVIAIGGFVGGMLVSLVAPLVFSHLAEYPIAVLVLIAATWPPTWLAWWRKASMPRGITRLAFVMIAAAAVGLGSWQAGEVHAMRNFYGIARIIDRAAGDGKPAYRVLVHGATVHGLQYAEPTLKQVPLAYYYLGGTLDRAASLRPRPARVAMIGLGAGGALPWFQPGEQVTVFEINPDMEELARTWFTYLRDSQATVAIKVGDARLKLLEESRQAQAPYDVIIIDAFSGDAVPTHLLTLEAIDIYLSRLAGDGLLVFHISNRFYDLRPVVRAAVGARGLAAVATRSRGYALDVLRTDSCVAVVAHTPARLAPLLADERWVALGHGDGLPTFRVWSDDYVNILGPLVANWRR
jgi:hypothetical protein